MPVGRRARTGRRRERRLARGGGTLHLRPLLGTRLDEDLAGAAVHGDHGSLGQLTGAGERHNGGHTESPGQNRAVARRSALLGDEAEDQRGVEQRRVRGSQVACDQHVRLVAVRHTGHRDAEQAGHDPVAYVVEVGDTAGQVLTGTGQQRTV